MRGESQSGTSHGLEKSFWLPLSWTCNSTPIVGFHPGYLSLLPFALPLPFGFAAEFDEVVANVRTIGENVEPRALNPQEHAVIGIRFIERNRPEVESAVKKRSTRLRHFLILTPHGIDLEKPFSPFTAPGA